ncbi:MAG: hypothetical protein JXR16_11445 [Bermanella sp.]
MMKSSNTSLLCQALIYVFILNIGNAYTDQYESYSIVTPQKKTAEEAKKTIEELEEGISTLKDSYTRDSTARFLARHYAQKKGEGNIEKALAYYQQALSGSGLSDIAKQEMIIEVIDIQYFLKDYNLVTQSIKQYQLLGGSLSIDLQLKLALSLHFSNKPQAAIFSAEKLYEFIRTTLFNHAIDPYVNPKLDMSTEQLTQLLFIFFENKRYTTSIELQTIILEKNNLVSDHWIRLSKIYLVDGQTEKAADILLLAAQKGIELEQKHILLLSDLMAQNNNPYIAARFLAQMINEFLVTAEFTHYEKLFSYWYAAQEMESAIKVANIMSDLIPNTERQLDIAEMYYKTQNWRLMRSTILKACEAGLDKVLVGRASYLLGVSEFKLDNFDNAKKAFINATLTGGYQKEAFQFLDYMNVDTQFSRNPSYLRRHDGPCGPEN